MWTTVQKRNDGVSLIRETDVEAIEQMTCLQVRKKLDALFDGEARLEETPEKTKRVLFGHLERCAACCRSFDVRARFRSGRGKGIY